MTFEQIHLLLTRALGEHRRIVYDIYSESGRSKGRSVGRRSSLVVSLPFLVNQNTSFYLPPRISPVALMASSVRATGDIQELDSSIETPKLGCLGRSFYSVPTLVFRAEGGAVGVQIIPWHPAATCRLDGKGHRPPGSTR